MGRDSVAWRRKGGGGQVINDHRRAAGSAPDSPTPPASRSAPPHKGEGGRLNLARLIAFSLPGLPIGALAVALPVYLPHYYAVHFGLGLGVGGAFMAVRLIDMLADPLIGVAMDRTRTRLGRYRVWLLAGAPLLAIPVWLLFLPPIAPSFAYLVAMLVLYYLGASVVTLAHIAWGSVVSVSYHERSRVFGAIQMTSIFAAATVALIPSLLGSTAEAVGARAMGLFIVVITPLGIALASTFTPERIAADVQAERFRLGEYWEMIMRPDMRRIILADFCLALGPGWMTALYLFYFHDARGFTAASSSALLFIYIVSGVAGAFAISKAAQRLGKHTTLMVCAVGYSVGLVAINFMPRGAFWPTAAIMVFNGLMAPSFVLLIRAMTADVGDAVRLEQGRNRMSLLYSLLTSVEKIAGALSIFLTYTVLAAVGYDSHEGAGNTPGAILGLQVVFLAGPVVFVTIGAACFFGYGLDHAAHAKIRQALDDRDAGLAAGTGEIHL